MHNESDQEAYEIYVSDFCKKDLVESEWVGPNMLCPQNSESAVKDLFRILHSERGKEAYQNCFLVSYK